MGQWLKEKEEVDRIAKKEAERAKIGSSAIKETVTTKRIYLLKSMNKNKNYVLATTEQMLEEFEFFKPWTKEESDIMFMVNHIHKTADEDGDIMRAVKILEEAIKASSGIRHNMPHDLYTLSKKHVDSLKKRNGDRARVILEANKWYSEVVFQQKNHHGSYDYGTLLFHIRDLKQLAIEGKNYQSKVDELERLVASSQIRGASVVSSCTIIE